MPIGIGFTAFFRIFAIIALPFEGNAARAAARNLKMILQQESANKQDILAIRCFEKEIAENLSNLLITEYANTCVLSVYSDLTKALQAYKVLAKPGLSSDPWVNASFHKQCHMDFDTLFDLVPRKFSPDAGEAGLSDQDIDIEYRKKTGHVHFAEGLLKYHDTRREDAIYVYRFNGIYSIFAFQAKRCVFANSFRCENETELLYFILNAMEINGLSQEKTRLYTDYSLMADHRLMEFLKPYFAEVKTLALEHDGIDTLIPELPELLFANHLMSLCV